MISNVVLFLLVMIDVRRCEFIRLPFQYPFILAMMCPCAGFVFYVGKKNPPELSEKQMSDQ